MVQVAVRRNTAGTITVRQQNGILVPSTSSPTLTLNNLGAAAASGRLDTLQDVVEGSPSNNYTLVYSSTNDKYYVQELDLDGGSF
jgi:hypothetical protein